MKLFKRYARRVNGKNKKKKKPIPFMRVNDTYIIVARSMAIARGISRIFFFLAIPIIASSFLSLTLSLFLATAKNLISSIERSLLFPAHIQPFLSEPTFL